MIVGSNLKNLNDDDLVTKANKIEISDNNPENKILSKMEAFEAVEP